MKRIYVRLSGRSGSWVLTPHGVFRLSNPGAIRPGHLHLIEYHPFDQWARIVEVFNDPGLSSFPTDRDFGNPQS